MKRGIKINSDTNQMLNKLDKSIGLASKYGLSKLNIQAINKEIKAARKNLKADS